MSLPRLSLTDARHLHLLLKGLLKKHAAGQPRQIFSRPFRACRYCKSTPSILWRAVPPVLFSRLGDYSPMAGRLVTAGRTDGILGARGLFCRAAILC